MVSSMNIMMSPMMNTLPMNFILYAYMNKLDHNRYRNKCYSKFEESFELRVGTYVNRYDEIVECACCGSGLGPIKGKVLTYLYDTVISIQINRIRSIALTILMIAMEMTEMARLRFGFALKIGAMVKKSVDVVTRSTKFQVKIFSWDRAENVLDSYLKNR